MAARQDSLIVARTTDGGHTFSVHGFIYENPGVINFYGEPAIVKIGGTYPNEHLVCAFRPNTGGHPGFTQSLDSGLTWETISLSTTVGSEVTNHNFGISAPQLCYDGVNIYMVVGNRYSLNPWAPADNAAYLFRKSVTYTGSLISNLDSGWSTGIKLGGGDAATTNFDVCFYGDVHDLGDGTILASYYACVGSPKSYGALYTPPTGLQTSNPYIAMKVIDKSTFSVVSPTKFSYGDLELLATANIDRILLAWPNLGGDGVTIEREVVE